MKLVTFEVRTVLGKFERLGLVMSNPTGSEPVVVNLNAAFAWILAGEGDAGQARRWADFLIPPDMRAFLEQGEAALSAAHRVQMCFEEVVEQEAESMLGIDDERLVFRMEDVVLKTPVRPRMLRDFLTFEQHTANGFAKRYESIPEAWYKMPVYYKGNPYTIIGPDEPLHWPSYSNKLDYELELACVIGREGRNIPEDKAWDYIAGFAVMNDFSARDIQKDEMMCRLGPAKGKDFATAVGPWLVTKDEISDIRNLRMTARINGETWSDGNSGTSHWTFEQMIAHVSKDETLYPGDILGSGTVGFGCGLELDKWLQPDDVVELEIEGLGVLRNKVVREAAVAAE